MTPLTPTIVVRRVLFWETVYDPKDGKRIHFVGWRNALKVLLERYVTT
jgi:hypothetical protein